jgi:hypothetical protein
MNKKPFLFQKNKKGGFRMNYKLIGYTFVKCLRGNIN